MTADIFFLFLLNVHLLNLLSVCHLSLYRCSLYHYWLACASCHLSPYKLQLLWGQLYWDLLNVSSWTYYLLHNLYSTWWRCHRVCHLLWLQLYNLGLRRLLLCLLTSYCLYSRLGLRLGSHLQMRMIIPRQSIYLFVQIILVLTYGSFLN